MRKKHTDKAEQAHVFQLQILQRLVNKACCSLDNSLGSDLLYGLLRPQNNIKYNEISIYIFLSKNNDLCPDTTSYLDCSD